MRVIFAGSRSLYQKMSVIDDAIEASGFNVTHVIHGGCPRGIDSLVEFWSVNQRCRGSKLRVIKIEADWERMGKSAGYHRNLQMAKIADALIAIWDGKSPGTRNMINIMKKRGKPVYVHKIQPKRRRSGDESGLEQPENLVSRILLPEY